MNEVSRVEVAAKTLSSLAKSVNASVPFDVDTEIVDGYESDEGAFRSYTGYLPKDRELRLNFPWDTPDRVYSVDLFDEDSITPQDTIVFNEGLDLPRISKIVVDLVHGNLDDADRPAKDVRRVRGGIGQQKIVQWLEEAKHSKQRVRAIQDERLSRVYIDYVRSLADGAKALSQGSFTNQVKQFLAANGLKNRYARGPYVRKMVAKESPIPLPEEENIVKEFGSVNDTLSSWKDIFDDIHDDFEEMMENKNEYPYGMVLYGNGGTGKSYFFEEQAPKYDSVIIKGAPNTTTLFNILYENRDKELVVFDDADSVIISPNSVNLLKAALTDTGERRVFAPNKSAMKDKELVSLGGNQQYFVFNASAVVITNVKQGIKDQALESRVYAIALFMTKEDIIEKIRATCDPAVFGVTADQADAVAGFLTELVEDGRFEVRNQFVSYRFYKQGLKFIKRHPEKWRGKMLRKLRIGIRTSI